MPLQAPVRAVLVLIQLGKAQCVKEAFARFENMLYFLILLGATGVTETTSPLRFSSNILLQLQKTIFNCINNNNTGHGNQGVQFLTVTNATPLFLMSVLRE